MVTEKKEKVGLKQEAPLYRALVPVVLTTDHQYYPAGSILDLSHLTEESRRWFVDNGFYETADGEPENDPAVPVKPCKNC